MSIGLEIEDKMVFLRNPDRYIIDTEKLPTIGNGYKLEINHTFKKITWEPELIKLVPVAAILDTLSFPQETKWLYDKIKRHRVINLAIENYMEENQKFFEKGYEIPKKWKDVEYLLSIGTIVSKDTENTRSFFVSNIGSYGGIVDLSDKETLRKAQVLVYPDWY